MIDSELYDYVSKHLEMLQIKEEILWAMERIRKFLDSPKVILENGVYDGGNICTLSNLLSTDGLIIGIDHDIDRLNRNEKFIKDTCKCEVVLVKKEIQESFDIVKDILNGREIDILFHDSIHSEKQLKWEIFNFGTLTNSIRNVLVVHDILFGCKGYNDLLIDGSERLGKYWNELKSWYSYEEKRLPSPQDAKGLGILFLESKLWK